MVAQFVLNLSYRKWTLKTDNIIVKKRVEVNKLTLFSYFVPLTYFPRTIRDWNKLPDSVVLAPSIVAGTIWLQALKYHL